MTTLSLGPMRRALFVAIVGSTSLARVAVADPTDPPADGATVSGTRIVVPVVATSPLQGPGLDPDKVPGLIQSLGSEDFTRLHAMSPTETLMQRVPGVSTSD